MKGIFIALGSFVLGATAGYILASRKLVKEFDERIQDELKESREDYIRFSKNYDECDEEETEVISKDYNKSDNVVAIDYTTMYKAKPKYIIVTEDETPSVDTLTFLTLYTDGTLVDDATDEPVHPVKTIGFDILRDFRNDSNSDEIYVHNTARDIYYVVTKADMPYSGEEPPYENEEGGDKEV